MWVLHQIYLVKDVDKTAPNFSIEMTKVKITNYYSQNLPWSVIQNNNKKMYLIFCHYMNYYVVHSFSFLNLAE